MSVRFRIFSLGHAKPRMASASSWSPLSETLLEDRSNSSRLANSPRRITCVSDTMPELWIWQSLSRSTRTGARLAPDSPSGHTDRMNHSKPRRCSGHVDRSISSSRAKPEKSTVLKKASTPSMSLVSRRKRPRMWHSDSCAASANA